MDLPRAKSCVHLLAVEGEEDRFNLFRWIGLRSIDPEHPELFGYKLPNIDRWEWGEETKRCLANRYPSLHSISRLKRFTKCETNT